MATSSIHISSDFDSLHLIQHNTRATQPSYLLDEKHRLPNENLFDDKQSFAMYREELKNRTEAYTNRTGKKLPKNTKTNLSAVLNLNQNHTMQDLKKVIAHLEDTLGTKVFCASIHRDEGFIDSETKKPNYNFHAHIEFMGLDKQGNSVRKKLDKAYLFTLQTKVAELLQMERGEKYSKAHRMDTHEYREHKKILEKEVRKEVHRVTKDYQQKWVSAESLSRILQTENNNLRDELKKMGATRADYAKLENEIKALKAQIKAKELSERELHEKIEIMRNSTVYGSNMAINPILEDKIKENTYHISSKARDIQNTKVQNTSGDDLDYAIPSVQDFVKSANEVANKLNALKPVSMDIPDGFMKTKTLKFYDFDTIQKVIKDMFDYLKSSAISYKNLGIVNNSHINDLTNKINDIQKSSQEIEQYSNDIKKTYELEKEKILAPTRKSILEIQQEEQIQQKSSMKM